jgi:tetratricopeptide (TPR) repeat protein
MRSIVVAVLISLSVLASPATLSAQEGASVAPGRTEKPICKEGGTIQEGWYVFAQDDATNWPDLKCPRTPSLDDTHYNVWRTAPAVGEILYACRDTHLPGGYTIIQKLFTSDCPWTGMNLIGEPAPNAYKLTQQISDQKAGAMPEASSIVKIDPRAQEAAREAGRHAALGNDYFANRQYGEAEAKFREAATVEPGSADWPALVALALVFQEKSDEAETEAEISVRLDPKNALAHTALAAAFTGQGLWREAELEARVALRLDPTNSRGVPGFSPFLLGLSLWHAGKREQGEQILRNVSEKFERYRGKLAQLLFETGKLNEAEAEYRKALTTRPDDPFLLQGLQEVVAAKNQSR